jgi:hypothetical protein
MIIYEIDERKSEINKYKKDKYLIVIYLIDA